MMLKGCLTRRHMTAEVKFNICKEFKINQCRNCFKRTLHVSLRSVCVFPKTPIFFTVKVSFSIGVWKPWAPPHVMFLTTYIRDLKRKRIDFLLDCNSGSFRNQDEVLQSIIIRENVLPSRTTLNSPRVHVQWQFEWIYRWRWEGHSTSTEWMYRNLGPQWLRWCRRRCWCN